MTFADSFGKYRNSTFPPRIVSQSSVPSCCFSKFAGKLQDFVTLADSKWGDQSLLDGGTRNDAHSTAGILRSCRGFFSFFGSSKRPNLNFVRVHYRFYSWLNFVVKNNKVHNSIHLGTIHYLFSYLLLLEGIIVAMFY